MLHRIWAMFKARTLEFSRDKSSLGWSMLFPFLIIAGFSLMFTEESKSMYKAGIILSESGESIENSKQYSAFRELKYLEFINFPDRDRALDKLKHHQVDVVIDPVSGKYWVSESSPSGYIIEKMLAAAGADPDGGFRKQVVSGREVPYVEWLFPGILGMNMMFSGLFGVGYIVVRYRKNGVLKRLSVTPMRSYEFLISQILSRIFIMFATTSIVYTGCSLLYGFECMGSLGSLFIVFLSGAFSMIALGLIIAARISSEELAEGLLNFIAWPMMFLSGVWFSLEGTAPWVKTFSQLFPLTHLIDSARMVMNDGAGLVEIRYSLMKMVVMSVVFLIIGSILFKWKQE